MKFLNNERWALIGALWQKYLKKWCLGEAQSLNKRGRIALEPRSQVAPGVVASGFNGLNSTVMDEARWSLFWSWRRVAEDERVKTYEQRIEYGQRELKI